MAKKRKAGVSEKAIRPKPEIDIGGCLRLRGEVEDARCGLAVAGFSLESTGTDVSKAAVKLALAGASTAVSPLERIKNQSLATPGSPVDKLARKVRAGAVRTRTLLKPKNGGDVPKDQLDQARKILSKTAASMAQLKIEVDHLCMKGRE